MTNPYRIEGLALPTVEELAAFLRITPEQFVAAFRIVGPALISFSGGRTSAFMLLCILVAHSGQLPGDVHVCFANTGKEREETLRFVHECATRWGVLVRWLEWRRRERGDPWEDGFDEVGYNSASRAGEPFAALIAQRKFLPNAVMRFCTQQLKVRTMEMFMRAQGLKRWTNAVGLRHDEQRRVKKLRARNLNGNDPMHSVAPLDDAKVSLADVDAFWAQQSFGLDLKPHEGNCDGCFLKAFGKLCRIEADRPGTLDWWVEQERATALVANKPMGARFVTEFSYASLVDGVHRQPEFPWNLLDSTENEHDAECGLWCAGEAA